MYAAAGDDELTGGPSAAREKTATYVLSRSVPLRDLPPGSYLLRVEAQLRGDPGKVVVRETAITVAAE
jgi:hypothetical protein